MSSRFHASALVLLLLLLAACDRETRDSRGQPLPESGSAPATTALQPGGATRPAPDPRAAAYEGNAYAVSQGARLYRWMNCVGCHSHGGGGMGPPLMDDQWRSRGRWRRTSCPAAPTR